jgi:hypothetical protein
LNLTFFKETGSCLSKSSNHQFHSFTLSPSANNNNNSTNNKNSRTATASTTNNNSLTQAASTTTTAFSALSKRSSADQNPTSSSFNSNSANLLFSKLKHKASSKMNSNTNNNNNSQAAADSNNNNTNKSKNNETVPKSTGLAESSSGNESSDTDTAAAAAAAAAVAAATSAATSGADYNRLSDLLQSRGLPSHLVNAFGSKVQQFLTRTINNGVSSRSTQLIQSLSQPDETLKLTSLTELCQLLVMGNEETLIGFPIKQAVPLLLQCMSSAESENFELMNHACRALTYMMESLPRSTSLIADGIGVLLEKLQIIQCMDVAEQSLTALEILSRRHSKQILNATQSGSIGACLTYIDFFSIVAQRNALKITANCCQNMLKSEFVHIQSSLPILSQRLETPSDKKSVESVCTVFARLVENFQRDSAILNEIASHGVLKNMQQLLVLQPAVISGSMFVTILHTIYLMCSNCNKLSVDLLDNNISQTLKFLLIGPNNNNTADSATNLSISSSRSPQELYEIVSIIGEIMPALPLNGIFSIDENIRKTCVSHQNEHVEWQWKDENEVWRPYTQIDSRIIESAYIQEEEECILNTIGRTYVIDYNSLMQINEESGTARSIKRVVLSSTLNTQNNSDSSSKTAELLESKDYRTDNLGQKPEIYVEFIRSLFNIVYEVYACSTAGSTATKHRSLRTLLRMIYFSSTLQSPTNTEHELLYDLLQNLPISSQIAAMLQSQQDTKIVVCALQMCDILIKNIPDIFQVYFHREGVVYQIDKLITAYEEEMPSSKTKSDNNNNTTTKTRQKSKSPISAAITATTAAPTTSNTATRSKYLRNIFTGRQNSTSDHSSYQLALSSSRRKSKSESDSGTVLARQSSLIDYNLIQENRELVRDWILKTAKEFRATHFSPTESSSSKSTNKKSSTDNLSNHKSVLDRLVDANQELLNDSSLNALKMFSQVLNEVDVSAFELIHSGFTQTLAQFLINPPHASQKIKNISQVELSFLINNEQKVLNVKKLLNVFCNLPLIETNVDDMTNVDLQTRLYSKLVQKFNSCLAQVENFEVKVHNVPNSIGGSVFGQNSAIKYFNTHQLKCLLQRYEETEDGQITTSNTSVVNGLRQWRSGYVKVDPLALVSTIEKYLLMRGIVAPASSQQQVVENSGSSTNTLTSSSTTSTTTAAVNMISKSLPASNPTALAALKEKSTKNTPKSAKKAEKSTKTTKKTSPNQKTSTSTKNNKNKSSSNQEDQEMELNHESSSDEMDEDEYEDFDDEDEDGGEGEEHDDFMDHDEINEDYSDDEDEIEDDEDEDNDEMTLSTFLLSGVAKSTSNSANFLDKLVATSSSGSSTSPKLCLVINSHVLPSNMTIFQAIKQYSSESTTLTTNSTNNNTDLNETGMGNNSLWSKVHLIQYKLADPTADPAAAPTTPKPVPATTSAPISITLKSSEQNSSKKTPKSKEKSVKEDQLTPSNFLLNDIAQTQFFSDLTTKKYDQSGEELSSSEATTCAMNTISLLNLLNEINRSWLLIYSSILNLNSQLSHQLNFLVPQTEFINSKLTTKANRQLQDPLVIMTGHLPKWLPHLMQTSQFLFPFETRLLYFYQSRMDRDRALQKLLDLVPEILHTMNQSNDTNHSSHSSSAQSDRLAPKLEKRKKTIDRYGDLIKQSDTILSDFTIANTRQPMLEIQYENEVGTGLGPTLEFYSLISLEMQKCEHQMWRGERVKLNSALGQTEDLFFSPSSSAQGGGLFPSPTNLHLKSTSNAKNQAQLNKLKSKFKFMGKLMAKALCDFRVLDLQLSHSFYKYLISPSSLSEHDLKYVDADLYRSVESLRDLIRKRRQLLLQGSQTKKKMPEKLKAKLDKLDKEVSDLELDFTLPGYAHIELKKGGKDILVDMSNLDEYLSLIVEWTLYKGVKCQMEAFKEGFDSLLPLESLKQFYPEELERLFCGSGFSAWDQKMLIECTRCDHGFTHDSKAVQYLFEIMCSFSQDEQRLFLQFVTGSPRLPIGGLKSLQPQLTIVRKTVDSGDNLSNAGHNNIQDNYLPSVMTCVNYLKLPEYSSIQVMREKLLKAMSDGQLSFHLS